jgi:AraC-like DNA-binding protein
MWSSEEPVLSTAVVLVRSGVFQRRCDGVVSVADTNTGYVQQAGQVQQVAHPDGGDVCTSITIADDIADRIAHSGRIVVAPAVYLAHWRLIVAARAAPSHSLLDDLTGEILAAFISPPRNPEPPAGAVAAVDEARLRLNSDPGIRLIDLAENVGRSTWYLSRIFHQVTGDTISSYRLRLRTRAAIDEFIDSDHPAGGLAALAARHGFADQAHMTRSIRRETNLPPTTLRTLHHAPTPGTFTANDGTPTMPSATSRANSPGTSPKASTLS